jgi:putative ABC transport system ATP-binding protein
MSEKRNSNIAIDISAMQFSWHGDPEPVLNIDQLQIPSGERVFIQGPSGSGKTTLLSIVAGVILPQHGFVKVNSRQLNEMSSAGRDRFRADTIGFIYQMFNLIPYMSVIENVTLPCRFSSIRRERSMGISSEVTAEALRLLNHLGMDEPNFLEKPVTELSVGQQQRVAAARALIGTPELLIADEPTSSLDADRREDFIRLLFSECDRNKTTVLFVSHDTSLEKMFDRTIRFGDINSV